MGLYLDILYCIILFAFAIYNANVIYRNYKSGASLGSGYSKIINTLGTVFWLIGLVFITSYRVVIVPLLLISLFDQLLLIRLKRHNKANRRGLDFLFMQNEIRKLQIRVWMMLGLLFVCVVFTYWDGSHYG